LIFFRDINKERVESCVARVNEALEQFHVRYRYSVDAGSQFFVGRT
jgi:hypothetical protein